MADAFLGSQGSKLRVDSEVQVSMNIEYDLAKIAQTFWAIHVAEPSSTNHISINLCLI